MDDNTIPEFLMAVKTGMTFYFAFIKVDLDRKGRSNKEYFDSIKLSFPNRAAVNRMISDYRATSEKTLYTAKTSEELQDIFERRPDFLFGMIFEDQWRLMQRTKKVKDEE